ncbi:MAG: DUF47 family protein [Clostridiaceae bacterium]|nr:DUF47 family protein [Clostridiaceae bacterium]
MRNREVNYFDLFIEEAKICHKAALELEKLINGKLNDEERIAQIHQIEHEGDKLQHTLLDHLNRSFITPIEREDIILISKYIEGTIDSIDEVAIMFNMLSVSKARTEAHAMAKLIVNGSKILLDATEEFKNFKKSKKLPELIVEINHIEEDGDKLYQNAVKELFSKESDVLEVIKWQNIFDIMETVLDKLEDAADAMESVIVKNS